MNSTEAQVFEKYAKPCLHCTCKIVLPNEYKWICLSCGYKVIKRKNELAKVQRKNFY